MQGNYDGQGKAGKMTGTPGESGMKGGHSTGYNVPNKNNCGKDFAGPGANGLAGGPGTDGLKGGEQG